MVISTCDGGLCSQAELPCSTLTCKLPIVERKKASNTISFHIRRARGAIIAALVGAFAAKKMKSCPLPFFLYSRVFVSKFRKIEINSPSTLDRKWIAHRILERRIKGWYASSELQSNSHIYPANNSTWTIHLTLFWESLKLNFCPHFREARFWHSLPGSTLLQRGLQSEGFIEACSGNIVFGRAYYNLTSSYL